MKNRIEKLVTEIKNRLSSVESIAALSWIRPLESDYNDPYFFISFDAYYKGELLSREERGRLFGDLEGFESGVVSAKDRFIIEAVSVRVEYKDIKRIDDLYFSESSDRLILRERSTYIFYRIKNGSVLFDKSGWLESFRDSLDNMPDKFWSVLKESCLITMLHALEDLSSSVFKHDDYFFMQSSAQFIKNLSSLMFIINKQFEPSGRMLSAQLFQLPKLPEHFSGRFESFLRNDDEFPPERKAELAQHLAKSVMYLQ
jgi:hypothetical protein